MLLLSSFRRPCHVGDLMKAEFLVHLWRSYSLAYRNIYLVNYIILFLCLRTRSLCRENRQNLSSLFKEYPLFHGLEDDLGFICLLIYLITPVCIGIMIKLTVCFKLWKEVTIYFRYADMFFHWIEHKEIHQHIISL